LFSESIELSFELTKAKVNDKIKLEWVFKLSYLSMNKNFDGQKLECFEDNKEFLVIDIVYNSQA